MSDDGDDGWTVQVRNLDGTVSFVGKPNLDISGTIVTLLEPNKVVEIPPGEEFIVRGIYDEEADVFALAMDGVALAMLDPYSTGAMRDGAEFMNNAWMQWLDRQNTPTEQSEQQDETGQDEQREQPQEIISIPFEEIEVPSDKG